MCVWGELGLVSFCSVVDESISFSSMHSLILSRPPLLPRVTGPCCLRLLPSAPTSTLSVALYWKQTPLCLSPPLIHILRFPPFTFTLLLFCRLCLPTHQPPPHRHMPTQLFLPLATYCSSVMASCCAICYSSRVFLLSSLSKLLPFWKVYV